MRIIDTLMLVALAVATAITSGAQTSAAVLGDIYAPLAMEEGTWDADVTFYDADKRASRAAGVQINTLRKNRHWIVNEFRIPATDATPAYEGHGVRGYDPVSKPNPHPLVKIEFTKRKSVVVPLK